MEKITITGTAENSKAGAIVVCSSGEVYFLQGLDEWEQKLYQKKVIVQGELKTEFYGEETLVNENGEYKQGVSGAVKKILNPKWDLVIDNQLNDKLLDEIKLTIPEGWELKADADKLIIKSREPAYVLFENKLNAPLNVESLEEKTERFRKFGKLSHSQIVFRLTKKLSEKDIEKIKQNNNRVEVKLEKLRENLKDIRISPKDGSYWPKDKEEESKIYEFQKKKESLKKEIKELPDYQSEHYALYFESETGLETEFVSVFPEKNSEDLYEIKIEILPKALTKIR